jgi:hypothetical protein
MSWTFWGPVIPFVALLFTGLRWTVLGATASGLAAGFFAAGALGVTLGLPGGLAGVMILVVHAAMVVAEGTAARLLGGGRLWATVGGAALAHATLLYLAWRDEAAAADEPALLLVLLPPALAGGCAAAWGAWLTRR